MLTPSVKWKWFIDPATGELKVELDSGLFFETAYVADDLHTLPNDQYFDIEQSNFFAQIAEAIIESELPFDHASQMQIALNGTAAICFHRPVVNKSWLYQKQNHCIYAHKPQFAWFRVDQQDNLALTLETEGESVLCLNLSEQFVTADNKVHEQFSLIRVLSDRLTSLEDIQDDDESFFKDSESI